MNDSPGDSISNAALHLRTEPIAFCSTIPFFAARNHAKHVKSTQFWVK